MLVKGIFLCCLQLNDELRVDWTLLGRGREARRWNCFHSFPGHLVQPPSFQSPSTAQDFRYYFMASTKTRQVQFRLSDSLFRFGFSSYHEQIQKSGCLLVGWSVGQGRVPKKIRQIIHILVNNIHAKDFLNPHLVTPPPPSFLFHFYKF